MNKIVFIVLDGAAGRPCKELDGKTSLEAASKPVIDSLFHNSINGLMHVIGPNIAPQSDVAAFALLGYNPFKVPARGVIEAVGSGIDYVNGQLAVRCNLARVINGRLLNVRLADLSRNDGLLIERLLNEGISLGVPFTFKHTVSYRGVLVIHNNLPANVSNTHPGYVRERVGLGVVSVARDIASGSLVSECKPLSSDSVRTSELINDFVTQAHEVLSKAGIKDSKGVVANYVLTRDAGNELPLLKSFSEVHNINMCLFAQMPVELGIAKLLSIKVLPDAEDFVVLSKRVIDSLRDYDAVYVHLKGPDKFAHLRDAKGKVREIERIDKEFMANLIKGLDLSKITVCVTSDHSTPAVIGSHSGDPVPYLITGNGVADGVFCESKVTKSFIEGRELMGKVISVAKSLS